MEANKKLHPIVTEVTELFLRDKKLSISLVFISQSYFKVPKIIRLKGKHYFTMKIHKKKNLQKISNHLSDTEFEDFMKLYQDYAKEPFPFLVNHDTTLSLDNSLKSRKTYLKGRNNYIRNFCGIYFCDLQPQLQKFLPQNCPKFSQSQKYWNLINRKNWFRILKKATNSSNFSQLKVIQISLQKW